MSDRSARTIRTFCPTCSGTVPRSEGSRAEKCPFCGHRSLVFRDEEELRYSLNPSFDDSTSIDIVRQQLVEKGVVSKRQAEELAFEKPRLYFVPFLWTTATVASLKKREVQFANAPEQKFDTKVEISDFETFDLAANLDGWGLRGLDINTLLARQHTSLPQLFDGTELRKQGLVLVPEKDFCPDGESNKRGEFIAERRRILFIPVRTVPYSYRGQRYEAHLESLEGQLLSARGPEDDRLRLPMALFILAIACLIVGKLARLALFLGSDFLSPDFLFFGLTGILVGAFVLLSALSFSWSLIRYEAEHIFKRGQLYSENLGKPNHTILDRLTNLTSDLLARFLGTSRSS